MNTNSNTYTVIYTSLVVVVVAAVLAFVSQKLGPMQEANDKAETISQILTAAQFGEKEHWQETGNAATIRFYKENLDSAVVIDRSGKVTGNLGDSRIFSISELKTQNYNIKDSGKACELPVYIFKSGVKVMPIYGAGLWAPVWGYIAVAQDNKTVVGAYFDHASETPGLGGKIKDDPEFRKQFCGKKIDFENSKEALNIVKAGAKHPNEDSCVDAITGATMTSKGLNAAICVWLEAYIPYLTDGGQSNE